MADLKKRDIGLLVVVMIAVGVIWLLWQVFYQTPGATVVVQVGTEEYGRYSLGEEQRIEIRQDDQIKNVLEIKENGAAMVHADCPDKLCIKQGTISYDGQSLCCLPHKVVVKIVGGEENDIDTMNQ